MRLTFLCTSNIDNNLPPASKGKRKEHTSSDCLQYACCQEASFILIIVTQGPYHDEYGDDCVGRSHRGGGIEFVERAVVERLLENAGGGCRKAGQHAPHNQQAFTTGQCYA